MNDVERELRQLGTQADASLPAHVTPRPEALRRIRLRRRLLSGSVVLCTALAAGGVVAATGSERERRPLPPAHEDRATPTPAVESRADRCGVPFEPTYLPDGFRVRPVDGPGGGGTNPDAVAHFAGPQGRFIDVTIPDGKGWQATEKVRIEVFGRRAVLGRIHEGFSVDFDIGRCDYQLLGYGVTRAELAAFAEGLVGTEERVASWFGAVWPEDTPREARRGCRDGNGRDDPEEVATQFAEEILRWRRPIGTESAEDGREVTLREDVFWGGGGPGGVRLTMREVLPGCWSVYTASPLEERRLTSLSVGVNGRMASIVFDDHGATSATVEFGYGNSTATTHWHDGDKAPTFLNVGTPRPGTGHFLVILRDENGDPFTAIGRPLPPGDYAAS